jgi:hypothetical protein
MDGLSTHLSPPQGRGQGTPPRTRHMRPDATKEKEPRPGGATARPGPPAAGPPPRKQIYLRSVYPLNPGIPHFVDVPGGW